jgi:alanyl-tRNA synthetase
MTSHEIRQKFLDFFASKAHKIVPSAPIVVKDDPTLMFTNAGMNQFKDFFLGNQVPDVRRIADTQKCLRVSGKHNDLEEVGRDGYHHTMFEMLGNWSFGDYFKKEAISWAWELLTEVYKLEKERLYVTVFGGNEKENLQPDEEAANFWRGFLPADRILHFGKKDNFWEMGDSGPCGPCSEIHIDLRSDADRAKLPGASLVNAGTPDVMEIWNLVFIQFNRKADGSLEELPEKHIDTGMGFERLSLVLQKKRSNYDTDIFTPIISYTEAASGLRYGGSFAPDAHTDIAMRVIADHIRAVCFAISDGELPSNTGAGYVIRRILRRAVRYYFTFLGLKAPFMHHLVSLLADEFETIFPELKKQEAFVEKVILEEERSFLRTLEDGIRRFETIEAVDGKIDGALAFEMYDTFGFPIDLTRLMASEKGWSMDDAGFERALKVQKERSRSDAAKVTGDWISLSENVEVQFVGYDTLEVADTRVIKHRTVQAKGKPAYHMVLDKTPFYAESGGQRGDRGWLHFRNEKIAVLDTQKEHDLVIHIVEKLPADMSEAAKAVVDPELRQATASNHSATHLMHAALQKVLGKHALQRGQDVDAQRLRFDFAHFQKMTTEELRQVESIVNLKIIENIPRKEDRKVPIEEAKNHGAMMLFGEKYGEEVRVITFDANFSRELCGGTHVAATGEIGYFKILSESAVAAGVRRIEAVTAKNAQEYIEKELETLQAIRVLFKNPANLTKQVADLQDENRHLRRELEKIQQDQAGDLQTTLKSKAQLMHGYHLLVERIDLEDANLIKSLAFNLEKEIGNSVIVLAAKVQDKPRLFVRISEELTDSKNLHAGNLVRELGKEIKGGGGGQPFYAEAGGSDLDGIPAALSKAKDLLS